MTPEQMQQARRQLEADLLARIRAFEGETGLLVRAVSCFGVHTIGGKRGTGEVSVTCEL